MKTSEILSKAADVIETRGLCKGKLFEAGAEPFSSDPDGVCPCCTSGAIMSVTDPSRHCSAFDQFQEHCSAFDQFQEYLGEMPVPRWNDRPETTKEEVISKLRLAAQELAGQGL
jgi:hypothetical protein